MDFAEYDNWNRRTGRIPTSNRNRNENVIEYMMTKEELLQKLSEIEWDDNNWPMPVLTERVQPEETLMTLVITSSDSSKVSPENIKMSPETDGMSPENAQTSPETNVVSLEMSPENVQTSQKIIELIRNNKNITMQEMANVLGLNKRSVATNIKKLQEHGLIRRVGANKNGYWEISA